jgi:hypothetical protein
MKVYFIKRKNLAKKRKKNLSNDPVKKEILNITRPPATRRPLPPSEILNIAIYKIDNLRFKYNYQNLNKIFNKLPTTYKNIIYKRNISKDLKDVGNGKFGFNLPEEKFEQQLNWFTLICLNHSTQINQFLKMKEEFEYSFLHADYQNAENITNNVSTTISYSFWGILSNLLINEYAYNIEDKIEYLSKLADEDSDSLIYYLFTIYFSRMVDNDISIQRYLDKINLDIYKYYDIEEKSIRHFIEAYLNPSQVFFSESHMGIFLGDEESSIIDIYINLRKIILSKILFSSDDMSVYINRILEKIDDQKLKNMMILISRENDILDFQSSEQTFKTFEILDYFSNEEYDKALKVSKEYLISYPVTIEMCEIYVKSHIYLNIPIEEIGISNSLLNKIIESMYNILLKNDSSESALIELYNLSFNLSIFDISKQIAIFVKKQIEPDLDNKYNKVSKIYTNNITPSFIDILYENKKQYLKGLYGISNEHTSTIKLFENLLLYENNFNEIECSAPLYRVTIYKARILFKKEQFSEVLNILSPILSEVKAFPHLLSEVINLLFSSYKELAEIDNCINLYVRYYFKNKNLVSYISLSGITPLIIENKFKDVSRSIQLPIFLHMAKAKEYVLFTSYRMFMRNEKLKKPSCIDYVKYNLYYVVYFLRYVCTQKILCTDVMNFHTQTSLDSERVKVCQLLAKIDEDNAKIYNEEIGEITQNTKIKERINEIDNSKIYVDESGVIDYELKNFSNHFLRYKKTYDLLISHEEELKFLNLENTSKDLEHNTHVEKNYISSREQLKKMFIELFYEVRDAYLFSNGYGLDYYLSTRVRHGIIEGQLRKPFSSDKLITVKNSDTEEYKNNTEIVQNLDISEDEKEIIFIILNQFSKNIDELITDIKDEYIHIKTENPKTKQHGFFDFSSHVWQHSLNVTFLKDFMDIQDYEKFIDKSISYCKYMTNWNLTKIRNLFNEQVKQGFIYYLDKLENDLKQLEFINQLTPIINSILHCRTEIQREIAIISSWFEQKDKISMDFTVNDAVVTSLEIIGNIYPIINLVIHKNINSDKIIKGKFFSHFVDCFKIFLENSADYCVKNNMSEAKINIDISTNEKNIICKVCNEIAEDTDIEILSNDLKRMNETISQNTNTSKMREDKNSGLRKANNMIKNVIGDSSNYLHINFVDNQVCVEFDFNLTRCT